MRLITKRVIFVAPFAGAWIEICYGFYIRHPEMVAPFAGAWIEIGKIN